MRELFVRNDENTIEESIIELTDPLDIFLMQIEMLLFTRVNDTLGAPRFGIDLESLIWSTRFNNYQLQEKIQSHIIEYCPLAQNYNTEVKVYFFKGDSLGQAQDFAYIDIIVDGRSLLGTII